jgi:hypothetical protein
MGDRRLAFRVQVDEEMWRAPWKYVVAYSFAAVALAIRDLADAVREHARSAPGG